MSIKRVTQKVWQQYVRVYVGKSAFYGEGVNMLEYRASYPGDAPRVCICRVNDSIDNRANLRKRIRDGELYLLADAPSEKT